MPWRGEAWMFGPTFEDGRRGEFRQESDVNVVGGVTGYRAGGTPVGNA
jgi:hypothetical protein